MKRQVWTFAWWDEALMFARVEAEVSDGVRHRVHRNPDTAMWEVSEATAPRRPHLELVVSR